MAQDEYHIPETSAEALDHDELESARLSFHLVEEKRAVSKISALPSLKTEIFR